MPSAAAKFNVLLALFAVDKSLLPITRTSLLPTVNLYSVLAISSAALIT